MKLKRPEILSPAGDFDKLRAAVRYGADAVYLAGEMFGMRAASGNFSHEELKEAVSFCHQRNVKVYVTVNIMPRDSAYGILEKYLEFLDSIRVDAVIVSDIGVLMLAKKAAPNVDIHISTQASTVSAATCRAWWELGAVRVVLARELSLEDIKVIRENIPEEMELECFVHGSMCIAYSGRCLLSQYFVGRDANRGACAQSCRWIFRPSEKADFSHADLALGEAEMTVYEEKRPEYTLPVVQSEGDTFVMSSRDMCMIEHIPELVEAGITSFKLEGRVRSAYYTAVVTNTYKMALEKYLADPEGYRYDPVWLRELCSVSHRQYDTGFFFTSPHENANIVDDMGYIREKAYLATAVTDSDEQGFAVFTQRNKFVKGDSVELLTVGEIGIPFKAEELYGENGEPIESTPHAAQLFRLKCPVKVSAGDILRGGE